MASEISYSHGKMRSYFSALGAMEMPGFHPKLDPGTSWIQQKPKYFSEIPLFYEEVSFTTAVSPPCHDTSHGKAEVAHELTVRPGATPTPQWLHFGGSGWVESVKGGLLDIYFSFSALTEMHTCEIRFRTSLLSAPSHLCGAGGDKQLPECLQAHRPCPPFRGNLGTCWLVFQGGRHVPLQGVAGAPGALTSD